VNPLRNTETNEKTMAISCPVFMTGLFCKLGARPGGVESFYLLLLRAAYFTHALAVVSQPFVLRHQPLDLGNRIAPRTMQPMIIGVVISALSAGWAFHWSGLSCMAGFSAALYR
jgi:hypothetical protein